MLKKVIKHIAALILLVILPFNTVGVIIYNHICHESGNTISSLYVMQSCNPDENSDTCCPNEAATHEKHEDICCESEDTCPSLEINSQDCCDDEVQYISMNIFCINENRDSVNVIKCVRDFKIIDYKLLVSNDNIEQVNLAFNYSYDLPDIVQIHPVLKISSESDEDNHIS